MTKDEFIFLIETRREYEFTYRGINYNLTYDKDDSGKSYIVFGQRYEGKRFESLGEFMNTAKVENHYFREMLSELD